MRVVAVLVGIAIMLLAIFFTLVAGELFVVEGSLHTKIFSSNYVFRLFGYNESVCETFVKSKNCFVSSF